MDLPRRQVLLSAAALALGSRAASAAELVVRRAKSKATVAECISARRFLRPHTAYWTRSAAGTETQVASDAVIWSPDGRFAAVLTFGSDVAANQNVLDIHVVDASRDDEGDLRRVAALRTSSLGRSADGGANELSLSARHHNPLVWWPDGKSMALMWSDAQGVNQVFRVFLDGSVTQLTDEPGPVEDFSVAPDGTLIVAAYLPPTDASHSVAAKGGLVETTDALEFLAEADGRTRTYRYTRFIKRPGKPPIRISGERGWLDLFQPNTLVPSPDSRRAIIDGTPLTIPASWSAYRNPFFASAMTEAATDRDAPASRQLKQAFVVDLATGLARPLWDALLEYGVSIAWSPDSRRVLVSPTFLPPEKSSEAGLEGYAAAVVEVSSGEFHELGLPSGIASGAARWISDDAVEIDAGGMAHRYRLAEGVWRPDGVRQATSDPEPPRLTIRESATNPPKLYARSRNGSERVLLDPNPGLEQRLEFPRVQRVQWNSGDRGVMDGVVYLPSSSRAGLIPFVIQVNCGPFADIFTLYGEFLGPGLGPGYSVFSAASLAARGIGVLSICDPPKAPNGTPQEGPYLAAVYDSAFEMLVSRGFADAARIGILGYSRNGFRVLFTLTHSATPYAAALVDDCFDGSYVQWVLMGGVGYNNINGPVRTSADLQEWLAKAPGFNADRVSCPLRMQISSAGAESALGPWEIYSRLKKRDAPVELFAIPDLKHGTHGLQNPAQVLATKGGAVRWFDFWLNGAAPNDPAKLKRYATHGTALA